MAQKTAWTGAALTQSDINTYLMHEGGAWTGWTPTLTQSATPTKTVTLANYARIGRTIIGSVRLDITSSGTANNAITVGLPVAAALGTARVIGTANWSDNSAGLTGANLLLVSTTTAVFLDTSALTATLYLGMTGSANGAAVASPDWISYSFMYEAAS